MSGMNDLEQFIKSCTENFDKSYTAIRNAYEKKYGAGSWEKIKVSKEAKDSKAKAEKLPFGSKKKLGTEEHERYTAAKKKLAGALGMPTSGWGLYGRTIVGALKNKEEKKGTEKSMSGIDELKEFAKAGGPYIGPKGGKWADPQHKISWDEKQGQSKGAGESDVKKPTEKKEAEQVKPKTVAEYDKLMKEYRAAVTKNRSNRMARRPLVPQPPKPVQPHGYQVHINGEYAHFHPSEDKEAAIEEARESIRKEGGSEADAKAAKITLVKKPRHYDKSMSGLADLDDFIKAESSNETMRAKLIAFFEKNPNPSDDELHKWAEGNGWNPHDVETVIYTLATEYSQFLNGGRSNEKGVKPSDVNAKELNAGVKVEKEHTPNTESTKRIALDHLAEIPDYYTRLKAMEDSAKKSLEDTDMKKAELPTGTPTMGGSGAEQGGKIDGVGKVNGSINSSAGEPVGAPKCETKKLSEDDEDVEQQMKPGKKPIETLKSTTPQGQRESVAHEHAIAVSKRLKDDDEDVEAGVGVKPTVEAPKQLKKSVEWNQGIDSRVIYSNRADMEATELLKSDDFYTNGSPSIGKKPLLSQQIVCPSCESLMSKSLSACPTCGQGAVRHRVAPGVVIGGAELSKSERRPKVLQPKIEKDLVLPDGYKPNNK